VRITEKVDVDATVKAIALGRIALGASYLATPALALRLWPGRPATTDDDGALLRMMARSTGGRDIGLGLGVLFAQKHDTPVRGWLEAGMLADVADAVAIAIAFRHLPRTKAVLMLGAALGTAAAGRQLARAVG
jgi:peptide-methionine (R)-S-oxide reductase